MASNLEFEQTVKATVEWYRSLYEQPQSILEQTKRQISCYQQDARTLGLAWAQWVCWIRFELPLYNGFPAWGDVWHALNPRRNLSRGLVRLIFRGLKLSRSRPGSSICKWQWILWYQSERCASFCDLLRHSFREEEIGASNYSRITVPPNIWFGFRMSDKLSLALNLANLPMTQPKWSERWMKRSITIGEGFMKVVLLADLEPASQSTQSRSQSPWCQLEDGRSFGTSCSTMLPMGIKISTWPWAIRLRWWEFLNCRALNADFTVDLQTGAVTPHQLDEVDWRVTLVDMVQTMTGGRVRGCNLCWQWNVFADLRRWSGNAFGSFDCFHLSTANW